MKNLRLFSLLFLSTIVFITSCHKNPGEPQAVLQVDRTTLNVQAAAGSEDIQITSNTDWKLTNVPSWITATPANGSGNGKVTLAYQANPATSERSATITLNYVNTSISIKLTQAGSAPSIDVDKTVLQEKGEGQQDSIIVTSSVPWKLEIPSSANWITTTDPTTGNAGVFKIHLNIAANSGITTQSANLTLSSTGPSLTPVTIGVTQAQPDIVITSFTPHAKGGDAITINGIGFSSVPSENLVYINYQTATVTSASESR